MRECQEALNAAIKLAADERRKYKQARTRGSKDLAVKHWEAHLYYMRLANRHAAAIRECGQ